MPGGIFGDYLRARGVTPESWATMSEFLQNSIRDEFLDTNPDVRQEELTNLQGKAVGTATETEDGLTDLDKAIAQMQADIRATEERKAAEATRLSTRNIGIAGRRGREMLLARGLTGGEIEQFLGAGIEGGARSLNDLLQQLSLQSQQAQTQAAQFGIGAQLTQEQINQRLLAMTQQGAQFQQQFGEQVRQFDVGQRQRQREQGFFGSQGLLSSALGSISFPIG